MGIGKRIRDARMKKNMTQQELADAVHAAKQTVQQWEKNDSLADYHKVKDVADALGVPPRYLISGEETMWDLNDEIFDPDKMYARLAAAAQTENLHDTAAALPYARQKHEGMTRKASPSASEDVPYIIHPLTMACHAYAMGIHDDTVLASILLHDVCEDCGVKPEELPVSEPVRHTVSLLTKPEPSRNPSAEERRKRDEAYYAGIAADPKASIVKAVDRCNNVSLMSLSFSDDKLREYITETEIYVMPLLHGIKDKAPEYADAEFLIEYQLRSAIESTKAMLNRRNALCK